MATGKQTGNGPPGYSRWWLLRGCFSRRIYLCYRTFFAEVPKDALKIFTNLQERHRNALSNRTPDVIEWYFLMH